jgi:hypothetical protein
VLFRDEARVVHKTLECLEQALGIVGNIVIRLQPHGLSHGAIQVGFGHITADQYCGVSDGCLLLPAGLVLCDTGLGNS